MAVDVVDNLLPLIRDAFDRAVSRDDELRKLRDKIANGGTYETVYQYAIKLAKHCSDAMLVYMTEDQLPNGRLYYNIAQRLITPQLQSMTNMLGGCVKDVQQAINESLEMQLNPLTADFDAERADNLAIYLSKMDELESVHAALESDVENFGLHYVDESMRKNAEFLSGSGLKVTVTRTAHDGACKWCKELEGSYDYDEIKHGSEVWSRHRSCRCTLIFNPERLPGADRRVVWSGFTSKKGT